MRFTSLAVEMIRARPALVFWLAVLAQAALWFVVPVVFYAGPPGDLAQALVIGREYQLGSEAGPPLAFWLADVAYRLVGGHMFGVYLLAQVCFVVTLWAVFSLGRLVAGAQQAVIAALLTVTISAFSFPGVEFGPSILARPLWALILLHAWQVAGIGQRKAWFALSFEIGLLFLTTAVAGLLIGLLLIFFVASERGRRALLSFDAVFALVVIGVLALPFLIWVLRADGGGMMPDWPAPADVFDNLLRWPSLFAGVVLALAGMGLLVLFNWNRVSPRVDGVADDAPTILRPPLDPFARAFVYFAAIVPVIAASLLAALTGQPRVFGGAGVLLAAGDVIHLRRQHILRTVWAGVVALPALFVVAVSLLQPWTTGAEVKTMMPAGEIGAFFAASFERRTGQPLAAVAGDPALAAVVALAAPGRPRAFNDAAPERTPWHTRTEFDRTGGVVVWRASDTAGTVPDDIRQRFPALTAEVPRAFERTVQGRQPLLRIGWAIVRPAGMAESVPQPSTPQPPAPR
jgi:hypothetical protein